jgi:hypothetical protein
MEEEKDAGGEWSSSSPPALHEGKQVPLTHCIRGWMKSGIEPQFLNCPSCSLVTVLTNLLQLLLEMLT